MALKANPGQIHADVGLLFAALDTRDCRAYTHDHAKMSSKGHGRLECRKAWTMSDAQLLAARRRTADCPGLMTSMKDGKGSD